jgi:hypothetical protein
MSNYDETIKQCIDILNSIQSDDVVPRNIRRNAEKVKNTLLGEDNPLAIKVASSISILDEISNDPNLPLHTRTLVWNVASQLETIPLD